MDKVAGFVTRKINYGDADEIITVLGKREVISMIALGTRRLTSKNRVALQIGNYVEIEYFKARLSNKLSKVKKASLLIQPPLRTANTAELILEVYNRLARLTTPSIKLYEALIDVYSYLGELYNQHVKTFIYFAYLDAIGLYPLNDMCVECHRTDRINGFEFYRGGFTCVNHSKQPRPLAELQAIKNLFSTFADYLPTSLAINEMLMGELKTYIAENAF